MKRSFPWVSTALLLTVLAVCPLYSSGQAATPIPTPCAKALTEYDWLLVISPIMLFIIFSAIITLALRKDRYFSIAKMLLEKKTEPPHEQTQVVANDIVGTNISTLSQTPSHQPSTSRYVLLISGVAAVAIGVCMSSFFIYMYRLSCQPPELSSLWALLSPLGIGVIPYAFNQFNTTTTKPS